MSPERFHAITSQYPRLTLAIVGDFCLDRYLEIDPARGEISIETGLPVYNVVNTRAQPGAAGTILNNLVALGIGTIYPAGFCGVDGEGFELRRSLQARAGVKLDYFVESPLRRTFTYCKPLILEPGKPPRELNRLDSKNWSPTPDALSTQLAANATRVAETANAMILMDQVDIAETGVVTQTVLAAVKELAATRATLPVIADSRRGLKGFPPVIFKMNATELAALTGARGELALEDAKQHAATLARQQGRVVFVTLAERGILGASPDGAVRHVTSLPLRGEIDIVGAGDSVTANLTAALAAGASTGEAIEIANAAASLVIHQLGTTGTASVAQIQALLFGV